MAVKQKMTFDTAFKSYRVLETLGQGGSGRVFKVIDTDGDLYAIKCLDPDKAIGEKLKRFKNELFFCLRNTHENIIRVLDYGVATIKSIDSPFYVMPYYPTTLRRLMQEGIDHEQALQYFSQILNGVEAAHLQSIWHRDLKPENILCNPTSHALVVADFGIAHFAEEQLYTLVETKPADRFANFQYAAPEQRVKGQPVDHGADIYALGLILNEMFTGILLQGTGHKTIASVASDYAYLDDLVDLMIRQSPKERPACIDEIKQRLIAKRNEFVSRQKLSQLKNEVVPRFEVEDSLISDPVKLVNFDYQKGTLFLKLSQSVNPIWVDCFHDIEYRYGVIGELPSDFRLENATAIIQLPDTSKGQRLVDSFKNYLEAANGLYKKQVIRAQRRREEAERQALETRIKEEETRHEILKNVKI